MFVPGAGNAEVNLMATAPALTVFLGVGKTNIKQTSQPSLWVFWQGCAECIGVYGVAWLGLDIQPSLGEQSRLHWRRF